ncbi:peroxisomal biogenesis factor 11 [Podospora appendiculata]|uniref:Peroxisomal biogenesis factor 11 n=1 Tax=Podospora appendiculata TaxID=314037 RepID=A0AAE1CEG8_9PEZI|nr:peroxisomal biogenesis factor 11 [Podospora appendiculata]
MSSTTTFEQLVRFTTDAAGLERTLRLFQSIAQILSSFPFALGVLVHILNTSTSKLHAAAATQFVLQGIHQRLNFARRFFRVFRCLESFNAAHKLQHGVSVPPSPSSKDSLNGLEAAAARWLDVLAPTFNGMYLLLDASTLVDALQVEGLRLWTPEWERTMFVEGQRFWLFALVCGLLSSLLKMRAVVVVERSRRVVVPKGECEKKSTSVQVTAENQTKRLLVLGRKAVANALDIVVPAVIVGWVDVSPGVVGLAMFVTTSLTGQEVWERCGGENEKASATDKT